MFGAKIERLLIVRLGAMGDVIHGLPAVAALRAAFPEAMLGWLIEERWAELLCTLPAPRSGPRSAQRPLVDRIHTVNTRQWRRAPFSVATWERVAASLSDLRASRYEVALDLQGAVRSSLLARWSGAPVIYGAAQPRENLASMFYTRPVITRGEHVVEQNLSLAEAVAQRKLRIPEFDLPRDDAAEEECDRRLEAQGTKEFALLSPGAGWGAKQWPAERYGEVARQLAERWRENADQFRPGRRRPRPRRGSQQRRRGRNLYRIAHPAHRAHPPRALVHRRRYRPHASGGRPGGSGGRDLRADRSGAQRPFRRPQHRAAQSRQHHQLQPYLPPDESLLEISAAQVVAAARQLLGESHG